MPGQRAKRTPKLESGDHNAAGSLQGTSGRDMPCTFALHPPCLKDQRIGRASKSPARWPRGSAKAFTASTCYSIYPFADLTPLPCASAVVLDRHATMASGTVAPSNPQRSGAAPAGSAACPLGAPRRPPGAPRRRPTPHSGERPQTLQTFCERSDSGRYFYSTCMCETLLTLQFSLRSQPIWQYKYKYIYIYTHTYIYIVRAIFVIPRICSCILRISL